MRTPSIQKSQRPLRPSPCSAPRPPKTQISHAARRLLAFSCRQFAASAVSQTRGFVHRLHREGYKRSKQRSSRRPLPAVKRNHFAAVTNPVELGQLLRTLDGYPGGLVVRSALPFAPLVFVLPGDLRRAEWGDIDFDRREWRFTTGKTGWH